MFSRIFSRMVGRGCGSCGSVSSRRQRRPARHLAAAAGLAMDAMESRVLLSTIYVDASAPGPTYNGSSWTTAYKDLQLALGASVSGDEIRIADGTYKPTSTTDRTISFALRDGVAVCGGYAGYGAAEPDARDIAAYPTILSGDIGAAGTKTDNSYHVLIASGVGASTVLDGVTVTGGNATGSSSSHYGGGLYAASASPTLINCIFIGNSAFHGGGLYNTASSPTLAYCAFSGNSADSSGGAMYNTSASSPVLTNCTFSNNSAIIDGGGMSNSSSSPTLSDCTFLRNSAVGIDSYGGYGGAMSNSGSWPTLTNCTISSNLASANGGGFHNTSSSPVLTNCMVSDNSVTGSGSSGGGMYNEDSSRPILANCTFSGNSASGFGGALCNDSSPPAIANCTFRGNSAEYGGAIYNAVSSAVLTNCAFNGNFATDSGGGLANLSASLGLTNCAFSGNYALNTGGALFNYCRYPQLRPLLANCTISGNAAINSGGGLTSIGSSPRLMNCIVWGNTTVSSGAQIYQSNSTATITYSSVQGGYDGVGVIDVDPLFVRNPSPGADGVWNGINDDYGDLRLQPGSPCIDRGNNGAAGLTGITTDLTGKPRFVDIALTPDAGAGTPPIVDMGAYEAQWACPAWLDPAEVGVWDASDYSLDIGGGVLTVAADDGNRSERLAAVRQAVALGRSVGAGIVSNAANEDRGVIAAVDGEGNILVRVAMLGDVTLDERIDGDDYFAMDLAFLGGTGEARAAADADVDGVVDGRDYLMLDRGFLRGVAGGVQQAGRPAAGGVFSSRSIAEELLIDEEAVLV